MGFETMIGSTFGHQFALTGGNLNVTGDFSATQDVLVDTSSPSLSLPIALGPAITISQDLSDAEQSALDQIHLSLDEVRNLEENTVGQGNSSLWSKSRVNRLTASNFGIICKRRVFTEKFSESVVFETADLSHVPAIKYGRETESVAIEGYNAQHRLNIYHYGEHYAPIMPMTGFLEKAYFCPHCDTGFQDYKTHICNKTCACCKTDEDCPIVKWRNCSDCLRVFKSNKCFDRHQVKNQNDNSVCDLFKKCKTYAKCYDARRTKHACYMSFCSICGLNRPFAHDCYIKKPVIKKRDPGVPRRIYEVCILRF
ncbi:uncharacterized protein LOC135500425 [Lineus longissimus]|uniref:uncharacterized protein LOC135500425 n=1 Tax=Lineus longissimus TaxID=88925 RepID=UPI00315D2EE5